jgi:Bifunctional DNA primase/polymerase, N-terminal
LGTIATAPSEAHHPFAACAPELYQAGWAPIPVAGRKPLISGFPDWRARLPESALERWAKNRPDADVGIIAGLCELDHGRRGAIILDYDDPGAIGQLQEAIGRHPTPCMSLSKRGEHHTYAACDEHGDPIDLRHLTTLRHHGINVDIKHSRDGKGIVIMPQSIHKDGFTRYRWKEGSGPGATYLKSPGLWGVQSHSGEDYFNEIFEEEAKTLKDMIEAFRTGQIEFEIRKGDGQ